MKTSQATILINSCRPYSGLFAYNTIFLLSMNANMCESIDSSVYVCVKCNAFGIPSYHSGERYILMFPFALFLFFCSIEPFVGRRLCAHTLHQKHATHTHTHTKHSQWHMHYTQFSLSEMTKCDRHRTNIMNIPE